MYFGSLVKMEFNDKLEATIENDFFFFFFFFGVPQLYLWGSPLLGEIFAYVTVF